MKTILSQVRFLTLAATATLLGTAGSALAAIEAPSAAMSPAGLRVTTRDEYKDLGFGKLRGAGVHGADGKQLGSVRDLILDARTGEPKFVIVSGGGLARIGADARLLPFEALIRESKGRDFLTRLQRIDWDLLPVMEKGDIEEGRLVLTTENRTNVARLRDQPWAQAFDVLGRGDENASAPRYVFASALIGKPLHGDGEKVGEVKDIYVDPRGGPALAVVEIDQDFVGAKHEYLVPLQSFQIPAGKGRVHTTLAADDFREAAGVRIETAPGAVRENGRWVRLRDRKDQIRHETPVASEPRDRSMDVVPAPTGLPSGYRPTERLSTQTLETAAQTIRERWGADPALKRQILRVAPDQGRLVLEGVVTTSRLADQAADTARRVTSGIEIENRIRIDTTQP